jgi:diguanylate cyclase (GGDEF)-like protein
MSSTDFRGLEATGVQKILRLLDALRHSQTGAVIYRQVERLLDDLSDNQQTVELAYVNLINQLLGAYVGHLREGSPLQVEVRLLQARLQPPLTAADLAALRDYVERYSSQIEALKRLDSELFRAAFEPLLATFGIVEGPPESGEETLAALPGRESSLTTVSPTDEEAPSKQEPVGEADAVPPRDWAVTEAADSAETGESGVAAGGGPVPAAVMEAAGEGAGAATPVDTAYRSHLDSKRRDIQKLQATLAQQVLGTIAQNEEFGVLLEVVLGELRQAGEVKELEDLRWTLIRETEKLTRGHHELAEKLDSTHHYLQLIESDSRRLSDELTRVRLLSLTDELTGLPNRRAFLRRIEDEVARVQRYGFPLSLALIDLDHFKQINDQYGHAGGDEVLQIYSKNILSIFRHHDLVARYGGEEFAVLLPNTDAEGSLRALTKVRARASEIRWKANDEMVPVPTFSAGVSLYKPGETAGAFIERADKALYRAKQLGRNRVEMDATYQSDADADISGKRGKGTER